MVIFKIKDYNEGNKIGRQYQITPHIFLWRPQLVVTSLSFSVSENHAQICNENKRNYRQNLYITQHIDKGKCGQGITNFPLVLHECKLFFTRGILGKSKVFNIFQRKNNRKKVQQWKVAFYHQVCTLKVWKNSNVAIL